MEKSEQTSSTIEVAKKAGVQSRQERKIRAIERFVRMSGILKQQGADEKTAHEIKTALQDVSPEEKALRIYESMIAYNLEKRVEKGKSDEEKTVPDPYFITEFQQLWSDDDARRIFLEKYGTARADITGYRLSELGSQLSEIESSISDARNKYVALKQDLNLQRVKNPTAVKAAKTKLEYQRRRLKELEDNERKIINLEGYEPIRENTDVMALLMYKTLERYKKEADAGFAWLPSRRDIHEKVNDSIEHTGKAPLLIGPPGTGKTTQIDAVAHERTGASVIRIPCHPGLSEEGLVFIRDIKSGEGAYDYKGTITEAATGYGHSLADKPIATHGRMASLDEISQLNIDRALGPIKDIQQAKSGKPFSRFAPREVLPGFQLAATSNIPITDERLDREFARIPTNYFEMTKENPELYEFMLAKLLREEGNLPLIDESDLAPAYQRVDLPENERETLKDGSIKIAEDRLVENPADVRHGFLYRFAGAIRAIQDSYIHGSQFNEKHLANTAIYEDIDGEGNIVVKGYVVDITDTSQFPGGQMLRLKSGASTITAEIVSKWMDGFAQSAERGLTGWLQQMVKEHIDQTSPEDAERIKAIADYFHLFDEQLRKTHIKPLTPKEIGYLSPRVPRPVYVERPIGEKAQKIPQEETQKQITKYQTTQVFLESGEQVLIKNQGFTLQEGFFDIQKGVVVPTTVDIGRKIKTQKGEYVTFAGVVEDENSAFHGKVVGRPVSGEELYYAFDSVKEVESGIFSYDADQVVREIEEDMPFMLKETK